MSLYDRLFKPRRYTLPNGAVVEEKRSRAPLVILIVLALGALSVHITGFTFAGLVKKGSKFFDILTAMFLGIGSNYVGSRILVTAGIASGLISVFFQRSFPSSCTSF